MEAILEKLKSNISESSYNQYARIYKILGLKSINDLDDTALILKKIEDKSENTKKNYLASIVKLLRVADTKDELLKEYSKLMQEKIESTKPTNEYNDKQRAELMTWNEIESIRDGMLVGINNFTTRINYEILLDWLILCIYTLIPPRRNLDYYDMKIAPNMDAINDTDNFLVWGKRKLFVFNTYKTKKAYGRQTQELPPKLVEAIKIYLLARKKIALPGNDNFLVKYGNMNMEHPNDITRSLNRSLQKKIGPSMLRHIYLSTKYGKVIKMMKEDAEDMAHSVEQQKEYIKN